MRDAHTGPSSQIRNFFSFCERFYALMRDARRTSQPRPSVLACVSSIKNNTVMNATSSEQV